MLFNEPRFFIFLLVVFTALLFGNQSWRKAVILVASYIFYGFWNWKFLSLIAISTAIDYSIGLALDRAQRPRHRIVLLWMSIGANLGILGFFKYFNFFIDSCTSLLASIGMDAHFSTLSIILPVGISFYTFQTMSYTIDVYRGTIKATRNPLDFSLFVAFFPQLVAGPIERASALLPQISRFNGVAWPGVKSGLMLMFMGYLKKVLVSDNIAPLVDSYFTDITGQSAWGLWSGVVLFAVQIYFDFSGYSDIARGISRMLGVELMVNFRRPYFAASFSDFWRRWHISLSTWLRDYLYIPLGGNRSGRVRTAINLGLTMLLGGLWHGASWNFVLWGAMHGAFLIGEKAVWGHLQKGNKMLRSSLWRIVVVGGIMLTWVPFRTANISATIAYYKGLLSLSLPILPKDAVVLVFACILICLVDGPAALVKDELFLQRWPAWLRNAIISGGLVAVAFTLVIHLNTARPFIYFQF